MRKRNIQERYFDWLYDLVSKDRFSDETSFYKLLSFLHDTEFRFCINGDGNRYADGIALQRRFLYDYVDDADDRALGGRCSILEMMVALAIRCEEDIMDDARMGDRTSQWFWSMITSLGLGSMTDDRFDKDYVKKVIDDFLNRDYAPNGKGGLFTIPNCDYDLREVEIWHQLCWYLDSIV